MKQFIIGFLFLLCGVAGYAQPGVDDYLAISPEDMDLLQKVIKLVDMGPSEAVMPDFDYLSEKYPDNYLVQYERLYYLYHLGRYEEVVKQKDFILGFKNTSWLAYQMIGNAYDILGEKKDAVKIYSEGLKRFPESGALYAELGNVYLSEEEYNKALEEYNHGIMVQPNFSSNYYRAAMLYLSSVESKVWGLIYAETAILLAPNNDSRQKDMSGMIVDCLKENIHMSFEGDPELKVALVPSRNITIDKEKDVVHLGFPGIYEGAISQPLNSMFMDSIPFECTLPQLIYIRKGLVEAYFSATDNLYGKSMYLLEFQKKIIDAGHWDAYNYFLFMFSFPEEFAGWLEANKDAFEAFIEWFNNDPFTLGEGRSVDPMQIFNSYRPLSLIEALVLQSKLLMKKDTAPGDE